VRNKGVRFALCVFTLKDLDYDIEWHTYPVPHTVCLDEIEDIDRWLVRVFG
jgi:phospholipase/carboxylesterase